ncbi:hypothetical protein B0T16DRAFT_416847 [Cercophora newfieldiana]|uniref:Uncharacterized protein n=1 Tax=Cercophora newfieldiana TaxID=92897 RepID=A0AA40CM03_9PEZI|nr:hypothetical protein B0T16DRAFT_416847 [Cercophora newfieldiana]
MEVKGHRDGRAHKEDVIDLTTPEPTGSWVALGPFGVWTPVEFKAASTLWPYVPTDLG